MKTIYLITGAAGHLGSTLVRLLRNKADAVYGLVLPGEKAALKDGGNVRYFAGDVRDSKSLELFFAGADGYDEIYVIHAAGIIDISGTVTPRLYEVNVGGTKNIIEMCRKHAVRRLVYVSSVHAIPEGDCNKVLTEIHHFSPDLVVGAYAKTKAEATQAVLDAAQEGLDAVVVQPSGILGPYDRAHNHMVQMVSDYIHGRLPAGVKGGYDFVDVRDVAQGCYEAARKGRRGECYILSNRRYDIRELLTMLRAINGGRRLPMLPVRLAEAAAPVMQVYAKLKRQRPLYTRYSLYTLTSNAKFSHDKATAELGYRPRDLFQTLKDTVLWLRRNEKSPGCI